jgi:methylated-DNA-protein-cysteine methyltransferase-like protein
MRLSQLEAPKLNPQNPYPEFSKSKPSDQSSQQRRREAYRHFCDQVYELVKAIPSGKVMTYGGIAALIPKPDGIDPLAYRRIRARWVGYALKSCPEDVPWWRVVNAKGQVSPRMGHGPHIQPLMLEEEGILVEANQIQDLKSVLWIPEG